MNRIGDRLATKRPQLQVYALLCLGVLGVTAVATVTNPGSFSPYFGTVPPLIAVLLVVVLGAVLWTVLLPRGWTVHEPGTLRRSLPFVVVLPTLLAAGMVVIDLLVVLPPDVNVPSPDSLFFYPAIGFVVEVVFHLVPLSVLLLVASAWSGEPDRPELV